MNEEAEFLRQLAENPNDMTLRGVYADWLAENGRPAYAEAVRGNQSAPYETWNGGSYQTHGPLHESFHGRVNYRHGNVNSTLTTYIVPPHNPRSWIVLTSAHPESEVGGMLRRMRDEGVNLTGSFRDDETQLQQHLSHVEPPPPERMSRRKRLPELTSPRADALTSPDTAVRYGKRAQAALAGLAARTKQVAPLVRRERVRRYSMNDHAEFIRQINANPQDMTTRGVYADYLQENEPNVDPKLLKTLRTHKGNVWVHHSPNGVIGGRPLTWGEMRKANEHTSDRPPVNENDEHYGVFADPSYFHPLGDEVLEGKPYAGPGGHYFVSRTRTPEDDSGGYDWGIHKFNPDTGAIDVFHDYAMSSEEAHNHARNAAATPPAPITSPPEEPPPSPPPPPSAPPPKGPPKPISLADLMKPRRKERRESLRKYGRAPADEVLGIASQQAEHGGYYDPTNHSDHVLADKLDDHADPLAEVVRRDLSYREPNDNDGNLFDRKVQDHINNLGRAGSPLESDRQANMVYERLPNGSGWIETAPYGNDGSNNGLSYLVKWVASSPSGGGISVYYAAMSPEETIHLLNEHGVAHNLQLPWQTQQPPEQMSRRGCVRKYSLEASMKGFHQQFHESQHDNTNHLVYADWLEEQGKPAHAEAIRSERSQPNPDTYISSLGGSWWKSHIEPGQFFVTKSGSGVSLLNRSLIHPNSAFWYDWNLENEEQAGEAFNRLVQEGAVPNPRDVAEPEPEQLSRHAGSGSFLQRRLRYAAYDEHGVPDQPIDNEPNWRECFNCRRVYPSNQFTDNPNGDGVICPSCGHAGWPDSVDDFDGEEGDYNTIPNPFYNPPPTQLKRRYAAGKSKETGEQLRETAFRLNDELEIGPDYQRLFWNPKTKVAWYVTADGDEESEVKKIRNALENVPGVDHVRVEAEYFPPDDDSGWVEMYDRNNPDEGWMPWPPKERKSRRRYAAYRAPAGGMVVRGTQYKGGEMVPDMQGAFANPPIRKEEGADAADGVNSLPPGPSDQSDYGKPQRRIDVLRRIAARRKKKVQNSRQEALTTGPLTSINTVALRRTTLVNRVKRYSTVNDKQSFLEALANNENDTTTRKVFADWLEEHEPQSTTTDVLNTLRNHEGRLWVGLSPKGKVNAIPRLSKEFLAKYLDAGFGHGKEFYHSTSTNSRGQAHRVRVSGRMKTWKTRPDEFRVPWKYGLYDNGEFNHRNVHEWLVSDPTAEPVESATVNS